MHDNDVNTSSCKPSAKYSLSLSEVKLSNGSTAIDLSIVALAIRGRSSTPVKTDTAIPHAASRTRLRRRLGKSAGGAVAPCSRLGADRSKAQPRTNAKGKPAR